MAMMMGALTAPGEARLYAGMEADARRPRRLRPEVEMIRRRVSLALARFRTSNRKNQADVAKELGVSQSTIARWEAGTAEPRGPQVAQLAHYMGLSAESLLGVSGPGLRPGFPVPMIGWLGDCAELAQPAEPLTLPAWLPGLAEDGRGFFMAGKGAPGTVPGEVLVVRAFRASDLADAGALLESRGDRADARLILLDRPEARRYADSLHAGESPEAKRGWRLSHRVIYRITPT